MQTRNACARCGARPGSALLTQRAPRLPPSPPALNGIYYLMSAETRAARPGAGGLTRGTTRPPGSRRCPAPASPAPSSHTAPTHTHTHTCATPYLSPQPRQPPFSTRQQRCGAARLPTLTSAQAMASHPLAFFLCLLRRACRSTRARLTSLPCMHALLCSGTAHGSTPGSRNMPGRWPALNIHGAACPHHHLTTYWRRHRGE